MNARNILYLDIETTPALAYTWGLWDQNVALSQVVSDPRVMGFGWKFDQDRTQWIAEWDDGGRDAMLAKAWELLDDASVVVHYNGDRFDLPWLNGEFARVGLTPPSAYKSVDLYKIAKKNFRLLSYKLAYVSEALGLNSKLDTGGFKLWVECMEGDEKSRRKMGRYCIRDVDLLPPMLEKLRPYLPNAINWALLAGVEELACRKCGRGEYLTPKGTAYTAERAYPQWWCNPGHGGCGGWTRDKRHIGDTRGRGVS